MRDSLHHHHNHTALNHIYFVQHFNKFYNIYINYYQLSKQVEFRFRHCYSSPRYRHGIWDIFCQLAAIDRHIVYEIDAYMVDDVRLLDLRSRIGIQCIFRVLFRRILCLLSTCMVLCELRLLLDWRLDFDSLNSRLGEDIPFFIMNKLALI